jgi:hypothetical protein
MAAMKMASSARLHCALRASGSIGVIMVMANENGGNEAVMAKSNNGGGVWRRRENGNNRKRHGNNGGMKSVINGVMASAVMAWRNGVIKINQRNGINIGVMAKQWQSKWRRRRKMAKANKPKAEKLKISIRANRSWRSNETQ